MANFIRPPAGTAPNADACARGEQGFPYIVIRLAAAVYQCERLAISRGTPSVRIAPKNSQLSHPGVDEASRSLNDDARRFLEVAVLGAVQRNGTRMSVVYSADECVYLERDSSVNRSSEPPSGGISFSLDFSRPRQSG
jgi:hypothetical protein